MDRPRPTVPVVATPSGGAGCCGGRGPCLPGAAPAAPPASASSVLVTAGGGATASSLDLAYWLGLRASVASKKPLTLKAVVQVIRSLDGRDKVTKVS